MCVWLASATTFSPSAVDVDSFFSNFFLYVGQAKKGVLQTTDCRQDRAKRMSYSPNRSASRSQSPRRRSASPKAREPVESDDDYASKPKKEPEPPAPRPPRRGCAFIHSERGCRKGNECTFSHDPADAADPRWRKCAASGCSNLCRGALCQRCRGRQAQPRRERSKSPRRTSTRYREPPSQRSRARSRSKGRSRDRSRDPSRDYDRDTDRGRPDRSDRSRAYCSHCGRRY